MATIRLALAQINTTVGDLEGNKTKMLQAMARARQLGVDLIVFPEMSVPGYPPEDLCRIAACACKCRIADQEADVGCAALNRIDADVAAVEEIDFHMIGHGDALEVCFDAGIETRSPASGWRFRQPFCERASAGQARSTCADAHHLWATSYRQRGAGASPVEVDHRAILPKRRTSFDRGIGQRLVHGVAADAPTRIGHGRA